MLYDTDIDSFIAMILMLHDTDIIGIIAVILTLYDTDIFQNTHVIRNVSCVVCRSIGNGHGILCAIMGIESATYCYDTR